MRSFFGFLHRWVGLLTAAFLFVSGLTGAIISWDHELDELLNSHLVQARSSGSAISSLTLAEQVQARYPLAHVTFIPLHVEQGHSVGFGVDGRVDPATGQQAELGFNQIFIDPATGDELGKREWGAVWPVSSENIVSFLYKLHYSLHIPEMWGIDRWGIWLMGVIAMLWTLDCFVGAYLTLPAKRAGRNNLDARKASYWQRWKPAWKIRTASGAYKLNFDLHRAFSLWLWGLLFIVAFTAFSLNLFREVFVPVLSTVSEVTPTPFTARSPNSRHNPVEAGISMANAISIAKVDAEKRGWQEPVGSVFYSPEYGVYGVQFYYPDDDHGVGGAGHKRIYLDGKEGEVIGQRIPWSGTAADIFIQAQFPLHSGRILGIPGRILMSVMGLVVAMLSVTGVYIWFKKRKARLVVAKREVAFNQEGVLEGNC